MKGSSVYKVQNGKLLRVSVQEDNGRIAGIKVSGDFFLHPEEGIAVLEKELQGEALDEEKLREKISEIVERNSIQLFGFAAADLAKAIMMAVKG